MRSRFSSTLSYSLVFFFVGLFVAVLFLSQVTIARSQELILSEPTTSGEGSIQSENMGLVEIDFTRAFTVPVTHQQPIVQVISAHLVQLPSAAHFTVTASRTVDEWTEYVIVPTNVIDQNWENLKDEEIIKIAVNDQANGTEIEAYLIQPLVNHIRPANVPESFFPEPYLPAATYRFPWTNNNFWIKTQGWHSNAIDFAPNSSASWNVLAASGGNASIVCSDSYQVTFRISNSDGNSDYLHLDSSSAQTSLNGTQLSGGETLSTLYNGNAKVNGACDPSQYPNLQWNTTCGCGTGPHLHFRPPNQSINIDGFNITTVAGSADGTPYKSTNIPGGAGACTAPTLIAPGNNATLSNRTISFDWNAVTNCQFNGYRFRVCSFSPVSNIFNCFIDEFVSGTERTVTINNHDDMDLYWGVKAENAPNGASWAERKFRIDPDGGGDGDTCDSNESPDSDEVILFDEPNFNEGPCARLKIGPYDDLGDFEMNDKASSVRVGDDVDVILYVDADFNGDDQRIEQDHINLDDDSDVGKNEASSAKVIWENDDPPGNCDDPGPSQAVLFDGEDFENACVVLEVGLYPNFHDLSSDMNDLVSSIKTGDKVKLKLYEHSNYNQDRDGEMSTFDPGVEDEDLSDNTIGKNEATSAKVFYPLSSLPTLNDIDNGDGDGGFVLSWTSVQYAEHYDVYEQPPGGSWGTLIEDMSNLSLELNGKSVGTWCYKVRAGHFGESSQESASKCATVNPPLEPPETPHLLDIINPAAQGLFVVEWQMAARGENYELQEKMDASNWETIYTGPELSSGRVDRTDGHWCYHVKAMGLGGESGWSNEVCTIVTTIVAPPSTDLFWYAPGPANDFLHLSNGDGSFASVPRNVGGVYTPLIGNFNGDAMDDVFWYVPGTGGDYLHVSTGGGAYQSFPQRVNGTYTPLLGDFNGDGADDIFWYAPGTGADSLFLADWYGSFRSVPQRVNGTYIPLVGDFNEDWNDDIFWYAPGPAADSLFLSNGDGTFRSVAQKVNGANYKPLVGDFNGDGADDIFWYGPGTYVSDSLFLSNGDGTFRAVAQQVNGASYKPLIGDFDGDDKADIFWYAPGLTGDSLFLANGDGTFRAVAQSINGSYTPLVGDFNGDGAADIFWYAPGTAGDSLFLANGDGTFTSKAYQINGTYTPLVGSFD